jgi:hypothetical protein
VVGQRHAPAALLPGKRSGTHCTGGRVDTRAGLDGRGESGPVPGFDPWTVISRYSEYAILALSALCRCLEQIEIYLHAFDTSSCLDRKSVLPFLFPYTDEHRPLRLSITIRGKNDYRT